MYTNMLIPTDGSELAGARPYSPQARLKVACYGETIARTPDDSRPECSWMLDSISRNAAVRFCATGLTKLAASAADRIAIRNRFRWRSSSGSIIGNEHHPILGCALDG